MRRSKALLGHNLKYIQNQMGHGSIQATMDLYGHMTEEVRKGAAEKSFFWGTEWAQKKKKGHAFTQPLEMIW